MMERNRKGTIERRPHDFSTCAPVEVSREPLGLQRRGHEDHAEVWARGEQLAEEEEEQVRLRVALVHL